MRSPRRNWRRDCDFWRQRRKGNLHTMRRIVASPFPPVFHHAVKKARYAENVDLGSFLFAPLLFPSKMNFRGGNAAIVCACESVSSTDLLNSGIAQY
mmetsp:Transcript_16135/g.46549  ORF Transcript_16135/g.46549 Transcript_16135/m.46549 type:complete len:97 (+) Transcript_16135:124-414(+)